MMDNVKTLFNHTTRIVRNDRWGLDHLRTSCELGLVIELEDTEIV